MTTPATVADPGAPLAGQVVISLAEQYPGPYATALLADLGARVVMVERPGGEPTRHWPTLFRTLNRGKRSVTLDLKSPEGKAALEAMLADADVLIEGFRPGVLERLGFAPERLRAAHPRLVVVSISSYGQTGPDRSLGGHDLAVQGRAGLLADTADPVGAVPTADLVSGVFAALGTVTALLARTGRGHGAHVDVSMLDCLLSWQSVRMAEALTGETSGGYPPREPAYGVFPCADGRGVVLAVAGEDAQWAALCDELGIGWARDCGLAERERRCDELRGLIGEALSRRDSAEVCARLTAEAVSCSLVRTPAEALDDPQVRARGVIARSLPSRRPAVRQPLVFDGRAPWECSDAPEQGGAPR